jgi:hypothetical protein
MYAGGKRVVRIGCCLKSARESRRLRREADASGRLVAPLRQRTDAGASAKARLRAVLQRRIGANSACVATLRLAADARSAGRARSAAHSLP